MTSYGLIFKSVIAAWVLVLFEVMKIEVAWGLTFSFIIMDIFGFFRNDKAIIAERLQATMDDQESEEESRKGEFQRKLREAQEQYNKEATITLIDTDGNESKIILKPSGQIQTTGNPDPELVDAAQKLAQSIQIFGTEAVAQELERYIRELNDKELRDQAEQLKKDLKDKQD